MIWWRTTGAWTTSPSSFPLLPYYHVLSIPGYNGITWYSMIAWVGGRVYVQAVFFNSIFKSSSCPHIYRLGVGEGPGWAQIFHSFVYGRMQRFPLRKKEIFFFLFFCVTAIYTSNDQHWGSFPNSCLKSHYLIPTWWCQSWKCPTTKQVLDEFHWGRGLVALIRWWQVQHLAIQKFHHDLINIFCTVTVDQYFIADGMLIKLWLNF